MSKLVVEAVMEAASTCGTSASMVTYEDLLISSKFFYTEGSEDSNAMFPDEAKEHLPGKNCHLAEAASKPHADSRLLKCETQSSSTDVDIDVALEAACEDHAFLVNEMLPSYVRVCLCSNADLRRSSWWQLRVIL